MLHEKCTCTFVRPLIITRFCCRIGVLLYMFTGALSLDSWLAVTDQDEPTHRTLQAFEQKRRKRYGVALRLGMVRSPCLVVVPACVCLYLFAWCPQLDARLAVCFAARRDTPYRKIGGQCAAAKGSKLRWHCIEAGSMSLCWRTTLLIREVELLGAKCLWFVYNCLNK